MRTNRIIINLVSFVAIALFSAPAGAVDISIIGADRSSMGEVTSSPSVINGDGTATNGRFIVQGGDVVQNNSTVDVDTDGSTRGVLVLDALGEYYNNNGATTTFKNGGATGGMLQNDGKYTNSSTTIFETGSEYAGTGQFLNQADLFVHTGMVGNSALDLLMDTTLSTDGIVWVDGSSALFNGADFNHNASVAGSTFILRTTGDYNKEFNVGAANLEILAGPEAAAGSAFSFNDSVSAQNILVNNRVVTFTGDTTAAHVAGVIQYGNFEVGSGGEAIFAGSSATLTAGVTSNAGKMTFKAGSSYLGAGAAVGSLVNTGTLVFEANSVFALGAGSVTSNGGVMYYSTQTGNFSTLFGNTTLTGNAVLHITETAGSAAALSLNNAAATTSVYIDHGGNFASMDVKNANLYISGSQQVTRYTGAVSASNIMVENQGAEFGGSVSGNVTVKSVATFTNTSSFGGYNMTVQNGGIVNSNSANIAIHNGNTLQNNGTYNNNVGAALTNSGTFNNAGTFNNKGVYQGVGLLYNTGEFINDGTFVNATTVGITNAGNGVMRFNSGTIYSSPGAMLIRNIGNVYASAEMNGADLRLLMSDLNMDVSGANKGVFHIVASSDATLTGNYAFGASVAGTTANINAGTHSIKFADNSIFNAGNAAINIDGRVILGDDVSLVTASDFTVKSGAHLDFIQGNGYTSEIQAAKVVVANNGKVSVGVNNTLDIIGNLNVANKGLVDIAKGGTVDITGTATFENGGRVNVGESALLNATGDITFAGGSTVSITATNTDISRVVSGGNIIVGAPTEVIFIGTRDQVVDKYFMESLTGTVDYQNLTNSLYVFHVDKNAGGGDRVYVQGSRSTIDVMVDAFGGEEYLSINKINGGNYTDAVRNTVWGQNNADLNTYIQMAGSKNLGSHKSFAAFSQLYGEYAAYATAPLLANADSFRAIVRQQSLNRQGICMPVSSCDTPCEPNPCEDELYYGEEAYMDGQMAFVGGGGRVWAGGFGDWESHDNAKMLHGYDYSSAGVAVGYDYDLDGLVLGIAAGYNYGTLKVNDIDTKFHSDMLSISGYMGYNHATGLFARAAVGYYHGWNEYDVKMVLGGLKSGDYKNHAFSGSLEVGYQADLAGDFFLVPSVGLDYTHLRQDEWGEKTYPASAPLVANRFDQSRQNVFDIPLSLALGKEIQGDGYTVRPEVRGSWIHRASGRRGSINTGYTGSGLRTTMYGVNSSPNRGLVGAAVNAHFAKGLDVAVNYDYEFTGKYSNHSLSGVIGMTF